MTRAIPPPPLLLLLLLASSCTRAAPIAASPPTIDAGTGDAALIDAAPPDPPGTYMGRTLAQPMSHLGADWLDRANRDDVQKPEHVLDVIGAKEGQSVADVGCGSGYFTVHLSKRVGSRGEVYATDLQQEMLTLLEKKTKEQKITNVIPVLVTPDDAKLPKGALDIVLLVDVYHELPKPPVTLAQIKASLAQDGRLALVEYRAEDPAVAIKPDHKMALAQIKKELAANGFIFIASDESLPEQRIVTFHR